MRVVHLIASSGLYGAEKWIFALMRAMESSCFESIIVNLADSEGSLSEIVNSARERDFEAYDFYTGGKFNPFSILNLARWLKNNQIDIVHAHGYKSDVIGLLASRLASRKIISTPHGWSKEKDKKLQFYEKLDRSVFRFMDYVCPLSQDILSSIKSGIGLHKVKLILNGVDIDEVFNEKAVTPPLSGRFKIGYIGQLIERKNVATLIKALSILHSTGVEANLFIVGDGPEMHNLENFVNKLGLKNYVEFFGYRKNAISILKSFDVFVLPSLLEGIPRCVMEAMAAKVPVVASDIPGNRDLVTHDFNGLLYRVSDEKGLADALRGLLENPSLGAKFAKNAYKLVVERYSNRRMADEYALVYQVVGGLLGRPCEGNYI